MPVPRNSLKAALDAGETRCGIWLTQASGPIAEMAGNAGFDWCLIDAEHGPNTLTTIRDQLQALAGTAAHPVVRVPMGEDWMLKQVLDLGVQTIVVPLVDTGERAAQIAAAVRYPCQGSRGMGAMLARASGYGEIVDYVSSANAEIFLFVQIETAEAVRNIDAIAAVPGVDGLFIGPADLSADMGWVGQPQATPVQDAINHICARAIAAGKPVGTIAFDPADYQTEIDRGVTFLGLGGDSPLIRHALADLAAKAPR